MVIRRRVDAAPAVAPAVSAKQWLVAAYGQDGGAEGYLSPRSTLMFISSNAATYERDEAERQCKRMEAQRGWQGYVWVVEPLPKRPIDARTGLPTPPTSADMKTAVGEGMRKELAKDKLFRQQADKRVDTDVGSVVASVDHGIEDDEDDEDGTGDDEEGDDMVLVKKAGKSATKGKRATAGATKPVPKMKLRTAAKSASKRTAAATNGGGPCLCGCGAQARKWLMRGHVKKFFSQLADVKAGTAKPEALFGKQITAAMAPWKKLATGGQKPATTDFDKIRANV